MSCPYYSSSPSWYGYCQAKAEMARRSSNRRNTHESDGYLDYEHWRCYDCAAGNQRHKNCPRYKSV